MWGSGFEFGPFEARGSGLAASESIHGCIGT